MKKDWWFVYTAFTVIMGGILVIGACAEPPVQAPPIVYEYDTRTNLCFAHVQWSPALTEVDCFKVPAELRREQP